MSISFKNVSKSFGAKGDSGKKAVLQDVSFDVKEGEILFILGKSGVGKSVTLKCIVGLMRPDSGSIFVDQIPVHETPEEELPKVRRICGMVFQHPALLDSLTIFENVAFGLRHLDPKSARARAVECLNLVQLDESILGRFPPEISYGMQKRVSIARTIAPQPKVLLFDEPTTGLDPITTNAITDLILSLSSRLKVTSVVVSHDMSSALRAADRILVLEDGRVLALDGPAAIRQHPAPLIQDFLMETR